MEFQLENYKLRLLEDGTIERLYEFKTKQYWKEIKFQKHKNGYLHKDFYFTSGKKHISHHRLVYYAHNQDWDIDYEPCDNPIDHIDRDRGNNHISNLCLGTPSLNQQNRSNTKGYYWNKQRQKYQAYIKSNNKSIYIGEYKTEEEARQAYLDAKKLHHKW